MAGAVVYWLSFQHKELGRIISPFAMTDNKRLALYYDLEYEGFDEDIEFYRQYAALHGSPVLDLACGTGRVAVPLARHGFEVTCLDKSEAMLERARGNINRAGVQSKIRLVHADMADFTLPGQGLFGLAIVPLGSFSHLENISSQTDCLASIHKALRDGGGLVIDLANPLCALYPESSGELIYQCTLTMEGSQVRKFVSRVTHLAEQCEEVLLIYDAAGADGVIHRTADAFTLRYPFRFEMELLLERSGFEVQDVFGSYELDGYSSDSERMILVARKMPA